MSRSNADAVYGDGELPADADLVAPGAGESDSATTSESNASEFNTMEEE